jgi:hypothetical protein
MYNIVILAADFVWGMKWWLSQMLTQSVACCISFWFYRTVLLIFYLHLLRQIRTCLHVQAISFQDKKLNALCSMCFCDLKLPLSKKAHIILCLRVVMHQDSSLLCYWCIFKNLCVLTLRVLWRSFTYWPSVKLLQSFEMSELLTYHSVISQKTWMWSSIALRTWFHITIDVKCIHSRRNQLLNKRLFHLHMRTLVV